MHLNLYLFSKSIQDFKKPAVFAKNKGFQKLKLKNGKSAADIEVCYKKQPRDTTAPWIELLDSKFDTSPLRVAMNSLGAVVFVKADDRIFALTFGIGHFGLDKKQLDTDFGLQFAFRELKGGYLNLVDVRNFESKNRQQRAALSMKGALQEFGLKVDTELTYRISGVPSNDYWGKTIAGGTSLAFSRDVSLDDLPGLCKETLKVLKKKVKKDFERLNQFEVVRDEQKIKDLDNKLIEQLNSQSPSDVSLAMPDIEHVLCHAFHVAVKSKREKPVLADLTIADLKTALNDPNVNVANIDDLDSISIYGADDSGDPKTPKYPLQECLIATFDDGNTHKYVLSLGRWYRVSAQFIDQINNEVNSLPVINDANFLPAFAKTDGNGKPNTEPKYLVATVQSSRPALKVMDRNNWNGLGYDKIEVCDVYTQSQELICVKRYKCSQTLSHLYAQGSVSARMMKEVPDYRDHLAKEAGSVAAFDPNVNDMSKFKVVYAVVMPAGRAAPADLPLFSKVNLLDHVERIRAVGMAVALYTIPEVDGTAPQKTKKAKKSK